VVTRLRSDRLILAIDGRLIGLALKGPIPALPGADQFPGGHVYLDQREAVAGGAG
jgi:hypothetical protein